MAQKPVKRKDGGEDVVIYLRISTVIDEAIERYGKKMGMTTDSEAIRDLLRYALEKKKILE